MILIIKKRVIHDGTKKQESPILDWDIDDFWGDENDSYHMDNHSPKHTKCC